MSASPLSFAGARQAWSAFASQSGRPTRFGLGLRSRGAGRPPGRSIYDEVSAESAAVVIRRYSSSFGLASRLFPTDVRTDIRNIYALVRVADEVVDRHDPGLDPSVRAWMLTALQDDVRQALVAGHSSNLVVHAFANTARRSGIGGDLIDPFFDSMHMDLATVSHTAASFDRYVFGSAEVVGLMCLRVFLADDRALQDRPPGEYDALAPGARRLGAAFQKLNFLRDLGEDYELRGRSYFPDVDVEAFTDADRDVLLDDIEADLEAARAVIPLLPHRCRRAVAAAHATFAQLARRLRATPAQEILHTRLSVRTSAKVWVLARSLGGVRA